jgi:alpha-glucosidase
LTLELPNGLYACLSEAALVDFARTKFVVSDKKANTIACKLYGPVENSISFSSPWRVVMAAEQPGQLLENNFIMLNLNQPSAIKDVSWIKPGKIMWDLTNTTKGSKAAIDYAVKRNMQYINIDAGWYGFEGGDKSDATKVAADTVGYATDGSIDIEEVIKYGKERGIGVWLYVNQKHLAKQLDDILPLYKKWGVKGIKFGFVSVGSQFWTTWLHEAVRKCAKYEMLVDIHDEYRPTGYSRTYPNLISAEGVLSEMTPDATHDTHLAFTRFIAGPADFTLAYFTTTGTTFAHRLSLPIVFYNPIPPLYCYDGPDRYREEPEIELWDNLPTTWDDTKVIQGEIGKHITVARRSGSEWYVGAITNSEARSIKIPLSFLDNNATYTAYIYSDGGSEIKTATHVKVEQRTVKSNQTLSFDLKASGGLSLRLVKK